MEKINLKQIALKAINYDPFNLPENEFNKSMPIYLKVRALFKLMLYVHLQINFPRHWDADLGQYIKREGKSDYLPLTYEIDEILYYRTGNCSTYSTLFETLAKAIGFKVRHIGIIHPDKIQGHWCSEVFVEKQWIFFDAMYLNCPMSIINKTKKFYSAYEIMKNPYLYINNILDIFKGIQEQTWLNLWKGLEIDEIKSYDMNEKEFYDKFYGKR